MAISTNIYSYTGNSSITLPIGTLLVEYLIIGGGGGGGYAVYAGGGGGAGQMKTGFTFNPTQGTYPIIIGAGGAGGNSGTLSGVNGGNSSFNGITAYGGGGGGAGAGYGNGLNGGSGGGAGNALGAGGSAGSAIYGNFGNNGGGKYIGGPVIIAGGGGGAGGVGGTTVYPSLANGAGGAGKSSSITGSAVIYAGGGAGGKYGGARYGTSGTASNTIGGGGGGGGGGVYGTSKVNGTAGKNGGVILKVYVDSTPLYAGEIGTAQTINYGEIPSGFTITESATGGTTGYTYQWYSGATSGATNLIAGATGITYQAPALYSDTWYKLRVIDSTALPITQTGYTDAIKITVIQIYSGEIGTAQTIYKYVIPEVLNTTISPTGGTSGYSYQWYSGTTSGATDIVNNATGTTYQPPALISNTWYRKRVIDSATGLTKQTGYTNTIKITILELPFVYPDEEYLVAYFPFSGDAKDYSQYSASTTTHNVTLTTDKDGNANSAYYFNGVNAYISVAGYIHADTGGTVAMWVYSENNSDGCMFCDGSIETIAVGLDFLSNIYDYNNIGVRGDKCGDGLNYENYQPLELSDLSINNTWFYFTWTWNNVESKVYKNGILLGTFPKASNLGFHNPTDWLIGCREVWTTGKDKFFKGKLDKISIYNKVLTEENISALYSGGTISTPTLNGYLIDDDVTLQIIDTSYIKEYYEIWRNVDGTGYTLVDTIYYTGTTWIDNDILTGHTYYYKVRNKLTTYFSPTYYGTYSNIITAKIQTFLPATGLTVSDVGYTGLTLTWVNNNVSGITGNYVQRISGATWTTIATVSSGTTTYDVSGLSPNITYYFRIVSFNDVQTANSEAVQDTTLNPAPYGITATTITLFYQDLEWSLPAPAFGDYIVVQYRINGSGSAWTNAGTVGYNDTTFRLSGLTMGQDYEVRVVEHDNTFGNYYSASFVLEIPAPNFPLAFCQADAYAITGSTCGNADGQIQITNQEYLLYYDFGLTDVFGNVYTLTYDLYTGLTSGYYFLSATAKNEYKWFYGYDACYEQWLEINDSDTPMYLASMKVKPAQCLSFDVSYGRIWFNVSGLTTGNTYTFYAFTSDLSNVDTVTGCTGTTQFLIENAAPTCYYVMIVDEVTGCHLLIPNKCVPSIPFFSLGGIKKLYLAKWSSDLDYNYWKDSDEDYFLEFEDTSFFTSTKIKEYLSFTGGTTGITWYELPVANKVVKLGQKLEKLRQGFIFTDTLSVAIAKYDAAKWTQMATLLNPENKWIYIMQDADGYYWTGGYLHGAKISAYNFKTGARGEDNGCTLEIQAVSENKLLVNIDENYVINYVE